MNYKVGDRVKLLVPIRGEYPYAVITEIFNGGLSFKVDYDTPINGLTGFYGLNIKDVRKLTKLERALK